jgi:hypothetical protein
MKSNVLPCFALFTFVFATACDPLIERSGVVLDQKTRKPLAGVQIEVYLGHLQGDSLHVPVFTDSTGWFRIFEKRPASRDFLVHKEGYTGFTTRLNQPGDTILLEAVVADSTSK